MKICVCLEQDTFCKDLTEGVLGLLGPVHAALPSVAQVLHKVPVSRPQTMDPLVS